MQLPSELPVSCKSHGNLLRPAARLERTATATATKHKLVCTHS